MLEVVNEDRKSETTVYTGQIIGSEPPSPTKSGFINEYL